MTTSGFPLVSLGGRNVTVSLQSRTGHTNMLAVVGALVFTQYWYWFPLAHCLALAFTPTCLIALNAQLKMPKLEIRSNARPSVYAYPAPLEEKKREEREKVTTAVLSIAARARRRESERKARDSHEKMEVVSRIKSRRSELNNVTVGIIFRGFRICCSIENLRSCAGFGTSFSLLSNYLIRILRYFCIVIRGKKKIFIRFPERKELFPLFSY